MIKAKIIGLLLITILFNINLFSQTSTAKNQNRNTFFPTELGNKKWKPLISLDARRSFFKERPVKINGFKLGVQYLGVHRMGIGFYNLDRNVVFTDIQINQPGATDTSRIVFNTGFGALFYERVLYKTENWEFALPTEFLFGNINGYYEDSTGAFLPLPEVPFTGIAFGIQTKYNIYTWLAPRVVVGHRFLFKTTTEVKQSFNSAYFGFGIQILVGELYTAVKSKISIQ